MSAGGVEQTTEIPRPGYKHYYGFCEDDNVLIQIEVGPDADPEAKLPDPEEWGGFGLRCPVCDHTVSGGYEGADDWTTEAERTRRVRAEYELSRLANTPVVIL